MPKGYWIARVDVNDEAAYDEYRVLNGAAFAKFGGRFLVRAGTFDAPEGEARSRNVVIEFPSLQAARECYASAEYAVAMEKRKNASSGELLIIEGYDGPQPGE